MHESLATQLSKLEGQLPLVATSHFVMFQRTNSGPVAFLFERREPDGSQPTLHLQTEVQPEFQIRLYAGRKGKLIPKPSRTRFKFRYREPRKSVTLPAAAQCPKRSKWMKVADNLYDRLKAHDNEAWEELLGDILDIPSTPGKSSASEGTG